MSRFLSVMANPTSVKARRLTSRLVPALESAGWDVLQTGRAPGESAEEVAGRVEGSAALVVVGGDGTVRLVSDVARLTGIPMWQTSAGNENLFARSLNMHKGATSLLAALEQRRVHRIDRLRVGDRSSLLMLSSGFDADIVERVTASRTGLSRTGTIFCRPSRCSHAGSHRASPCVPTATWSSPVVVAGWSSPTALITAVDSIPSQARSWTTVGWMSSLFQCRVDSMRSTGSFDVVSVWRIGTVGCFEGDRLKPFGPVMSRSMWTPLRPGRSMGIQWSRPRYHAWVPWRCPSRRG